MVEKAARTDRLRKLRIEIDMLLGRPAVRDAEPAHGALVDPLEPRDLHRIEILVGEYRRRVLTTVLQVDDQLPRRAVRISIPVHATAGSRRQLGLDVRVEQPDPVIPGLDMLPLMRETAADTIGINLQPLPCAIRHREKHNVLKIGSAAARLVRMAEAIDHIVVVVVARRGEIGVGTELHHPKRSSRHRHDAAGRPSSHHRTDEGSRLRPSGKHRRIQRHRSRQNHFTVIHTGISFQRNGARPQGRPRPFRSITAIISCFWQPRPRGRADSRCCRQSAPGR